MVHDTGTTVEFQEADPPTDAELDAYIEARLSLLGVDLTVLPEDDEDAPADRRRIMEAARRFLRSVPSALAGLDLDPLGPAPTLYPAEASEWSRE